MSPDRPEVPAWTFAGLFALTLVTGVVDAAAFLGLAHTFTANMTGNVLLLGFAVTGTRATHIDHLSVVDTLIALSGFVTGAVVGAFAVGRRGRPARFAAGFAAELVLLGAVTALLALHHPPRLGVNGATVAQLAVGLLALAMGVQNATVRRMGLPDVNTTVLTTTLGGLAADVVEVGGQPARLGRRVATVVFLFLGAVVGATLERHGVWWSVTAACALAVAGVAALGISGRLGRADGAPDPGAGVR